MTFYENSYRLRDGAILVYTRRDRKKGAYQARLKIPGLTGYITKSLKTTDLNAALSEAEDLFYSLKAEQKQGIDIKTAGNLKFKDLWKRFYAAHEVGLSIHRQKLHKYFATKYLVPYFGEERVADMPDAFVEKYWDWRINFYKDAPKPEAGKMRNKEGVAIIPAQKTLDMEAGVLRQIFRWGKRVGSVKREPWVKAPKVKHTKGADRRPTFTEAEWKTIYEHLREWVKEGMDAVPGQNGGTLHKRGPHTLHRYQRECFRDYVLFMANSGLRPNEARQLLWRDIRTEDDVDGVPAVVVEVSPTTKTGARTVVCREGTGHYLERLRKISKHAAPGDYVFAGYDGKPIASFATAFFSLLKDLNLLDDRWGKRRTIYSLRHFYCTQSLLSGVPIHILAKNMGTSIRHIEEHYSHVLTVMQAKELRTKKFGRDA